MRRALLPYATGGTSIANVGRRVAALMVDNLAAGALGALVGILCLPLFLLAGEGAGAAAPVPGDMEAQMAWQFQFQATAQYAAEFMACVYFAFCEWRWGCGVGKWLMGLRVTDLQGQRPALWQTLLRTAFIPLALGLGLVSPMFMSSLASGDAADLFSLFETPGMFFLPLAAWGVWVLCGVTARARNGYRGIHEFATGTRVVRLQVGPRNRPLRTPAVAPVAVADGERFGPYAASGILATSAGRTVHVARDELLGRPVWVQVDPQGTAPPAGRIAVTRPTRPHWLQGGTTSSASGGPAAGTARWDAFEAVSGSPLPWAVHAQSGFTWEHGRVMLADLAEELAQGTDDGTLPPGLALEQVWVDRSGRVKVLDAPLKPITDGAAAGDGSGPPASAGEPITPEKAMDLLRTAGELCTRRQRLPSHAHDFLAELARRPRTRETLGWAAQELKGQIGRPAIIRWDDRLGMLCISMGVESQLYPLLAVAATRGLREVFPSWPRAAFYTSTAVLAVLIVALLGYFFRGGPFLQLLHTDVRRADGRPASRWRCMWRNLVTWAPWVIPDAPFTWLGFEMLLSMQPAMDDPLAGSPEQFLSMFSQLPWMTGGACTGGLMILAFAVGGILTLVFPQRGLHDLLAGTCLVPK
ncbi:MAG: RDD family protein [Planctomycetia bacterium]|nr:RDD family protein [Planctomycetia bacterium]